ERKFIVVIAVDKNNTGVNALTLHLHIEIHGAHRMHTDVLKQLLWPMLDRRRDVIGPKRIHGVHKAVAICMEGATQRFRRAGLVTSDFKYMIRALVAQN